MSSIELPKVERRSVETIRFDIFVGGDLADAKRVCRQYVHAHGFCVTVEPVTYIYTGGEEEGVRVGLINYPRFPLTADELHKHASWLAENLRAELQQHSYSIVGPAGTDWVSYRGITEAVIERQRAARGAQA
jgi:hypothetical protein